MSELNPITREEQFLAKAAGYDVEPPKPITRTEMFLQKISDRPGTGGGGDVDLGVTGATVGQTVKVSAVDENGKPTEWEAVDFSIPDDSHIESLIDNKLAQFSNAEGESF